LLFAIVSHYFTRKNQTYLYHHDIEETFLVKSHSIPIMIGKTSAAIACTVLGLLSIQASAFDLSVYGGDRCNGAAASGPIGVGDGCQKTPGSGLSSIILEWTHEDDNKLVFATYSDGNCCHARMIETLDWQAGCTVVKGGAQSYRVLNPDEADKGKEGDVYTC
jgi:hypothetical protein